MGDISSAKKSPDFDKETLLMSFMQMILYFPVESAQ